MGSELDVFNSPNGPQNSSQSVASKTSIQSSPVASVSVTTSALSGKKRSTNDEASPGASENLYSKVYKKKPGR